MRRPGQLALFLMICVSVAASLASATSIQRHAGGASPASETGLGPEMTEYMTFLDAELAELTHLHDAGDVSASDFRLSRDRLAATREAATRIALARGEDRVPELYILADNELTQILPTGAAALRGKKSGDRIGNDFLFHGRIRRSASFNVLERTGGILRATP